MRTHLTVAGSADIVINRDPDDTDAHDDVYVTIRDAFKAARRQLQDQVISRFREGTFRFSAPTAYPEAVLRCLAFSKADAGRGFIQDKMQAQRRLAR